MHPHLRRIVRVAEEMEDQFEVGRPFWQYLACYQAILDLLDNELGEDGLDLKGPLIEFLLVGEERQVFEFEPLLEGRHAALLVGGAAAGVVVARYRLKVLKKACSREAW